MRDAVAKVLAALALAVAVSAGPATLAHALDDDASSPDDDASMVIVVVVPPHDRNVSPTPTPTPTPTLTPGTPEPPERGGSSGSRGSLAQSGDQPTGILTFAAIGALLLATGAVLRGRAARNR